MSSLLRRSTRSIRTNWTPHHIAGRPLASTIRGLADKSSSGKEDGSDVNQDATGRTPPGPKEGAYPKILDEAPPSDPPKEVKEHNKEFEQRHDRASNKIDPEGKTQVGKGFWSGAAGGIESEPASGKDKKS